MIKTIIALVWLVLLTLTVGEIVRTQQEFLKFETLILSDNLKNEIRVSGVDYALVEVGTATYLDEETKRFPVVIPFYMEEGSFEAFENSLREQAIHVTQKDGTGE